MEHNKLLLNEIQHIPLFEALNDNQIEKILATTKKITLTPHTTLFEKGAHAEHFYMVRSGQIKLFTISANGDEKVVEILYPKQTFAEAVMFMPQHVYPVSAEAVVESEVFSFETKNFYNILQESQESCFRLLGVMSRHLHACINDINNLTLHNGTYRLVVFLLAQLPDGVTTFSDIHLSTPKNVIASRLSIQPETFSRILSRMSKQGLIQVNGNDISLLDVDGLKALF